MRTTVFDGIATALAKEKEVAKKVKALRYTPVLVSFVFPEDEAGLLYTELKKEAAARVGVEFVPHLASMGNDTAELVSRIEAAGGNENIHGVMVQKPAKRVWEGYFRDQSTLGFNSWWRGVADAIDPKKDVDCLTTTNLEKVSDGSWQILPATVKGVLTTLEIALGLKANSLSLKSKAENLNSKQIAVVGRSEIVGKPLAQVLRGKYKRVRVYGRELTKNDLLDCDVVVSATGVPNLITGEMVKEGVVVIDVGSPRGDVEFESVQPKSSFITPVPGGVGPMTVVSLLENLLVLV